MTSSKDKSIVAEILAIMVKQYYEPMLANVLDVRLLIPGSTKRICKLLQSRLREQGIDRSFLVIDDSESTDIEKGWLRVDGFTTLRTGSMVIIAFPGVVTTIQDSIFGTGGTATQVFTDEWPWVHEAVDGFEFDKMFIQKLLDAWSINSPDRAIFISLLMDGVLGATEANIERSKILFDQILDNFNPKGTPKLDSVLDKFMFHIGSPCINKINKKSLDTFKSLSLEIESIRNKCRKDNFTRKIIVDRSNEIFKNDKNDKELQDLETSLHFFYDGIGEPRKYLSGILSLSSSLKNDQCVEHWETLDLPTLRKIYGVPPKKKSQKPRITNITLKIISGVGVLSPDSKQFAGIAGSTIQLVIQYDFMDSPHNGKVVIKDRQTILNEHECTGKTDSFSFDINTSDERYRRGGKIILRINLNDFSGIKLDSKRSNIYICSENQQDFMIIAESFDVIPSISKEEAAKIEEEDINTISINSPSYVYLLTNNKINNIELNSPDKRIDLTKIEEGLLRTVTNVDPSEFFSGNIFLEACFESGRRSNINLASTIEQHGKFSIEEELRYFTFSGNWRGVRKLIEQFEGKASEPYGKLGISEIDSSRVNIARHMEQTQPEAMSALPLRININSTLNDSPKREGLTWRLGVDALPGAENGYNTHVEQLIETYHESRSKLICLYRDQFMLHDIVSKHPLYALLPTYIDSAEDEIESAIISYLECLIKIFQYVQEQQALEWHEIFSLLYLDCVVNTSEGNSSWFLIGPWHPLLVARRWLIQLNLVRSAKKNEAKNGDQGFHKLVELLATVDSFGRYPWLSERGRTMVSAQLSTTSDPGWIFGIPRPNEDLATIKNKLMANLGLDINLISGNTRFDISGYIKSFVRAHPSRRCLTVRVCQGYDTRLVIDTVRSLLYDEVEPSNLGKKLCGGINLVFENMDDIDLPQYEWRDPPVLVYECEDDNECFMKYGIDLMLVSPTRSLSISPAPRGLDNLKTPRGIGSSSAVTLPLIWLDSGASGVHNSVTFNGNSIFEQKDNSISSLLCSAISKIDEILVNPVVLTREVGLRFDMSCPWAVMPEDNVDPAIYVRYVLEGVSRGENRALWDYNVSFDNPSASYYTLSNVPSGFINAINGSPVFGGNDRAMEIINEMGKQGIAIGKEAMQASKKALGVIGVVAAVRLLLGTCDKLSPVQVNEEEGKLGFILPVDSFQNLFLMSSNKVDSRTSKRTDLLALQLSYSNGTTPMLRIYASAIECKYKTRLFRSEDRPYAVSQAEETYKHFEALVVSSLNKGGLPERLALAKLINFGIRVRQAGYTGPRVELLELNEKILTAILSGNYELAESKFKKILITTECELEKTSYTIGQGLWIRLSPNSWPCENETTELEQVREILRGMFIAPDENKTPVKEKENNKTDISLNNKNEINEENNEDYKSVDHVDNDKITSTKIESNDHVETHKLTSIKGAVLGFDNNNKPVYFRTSTDNMLDNFHVMITGSTGKGKTQLIKHIVNELRCDGVNVLLIDSKARDYSGEKNKVFVYQSNMNEWHVMYDGLPYNPLIPTPSTHPSTGELLINFGDHITAISSVFRSVFGLGDQQEADLKNILRECYQDYGITPRGQVPYDDHQEYPDFNLVGEKLYQSNNYVKIANRLDPLFDLGFFQERFKNTNFDNLLTNSCIINISDIKSDQIKGAIARMLVLASHNLLNTRTHQLELKQLFIFDEGHRILDSSYLENFVREARGYGVGIVIASQMPADFPEIISGNMGTKIIHGNSWDKTLASKIRNLIGWQGDDEEIQSLDMFDAIINNRHYTNIKIKTLTFPHSLIINALRDNDIQTYDSLKETEGVLKESIPDVLNHLMELGLLELFEDKYKLTSLGKEI